VGSWCRGGACDEIAWARAAGETPGTGWAALTFDLGAIDAELLAGDSLELTVTVPGESEHHVWLAYDSIETPGRFVYEPAL
jgi:hypothetical protein